MTNMMIDEKIKALRALEEQAAELKAKVDDIRNELRAELDERKVDSVDTGSHRVFWNCFEKAGVDTAKLKAAGLYDMYSKKSVVTQLRITDVAVV